MENILNNTLFIDLIVVLPLITISIILSIVNRKKKSYALRVILRAFGILISISLGFLLLYVFLAIMFTSFYIIYIVLYYCFIIVFTKDVSTFLSLFGVLALGVYFPDKLGSLIFKLLALVTKMNYYKIYPSFIKFLRLKLWVYLFAFLITLISSIESISGNSFINLSIWNNIKPFIIQSVVAFIAFDRFINLFKTQLPDVKKDITHMINYISNLLSEKN